MSSLAAAICWPVLPSLPNQSKIVQVPAASRTEASGRIWNSIVKSALKSTAERHYAQLEIQVTNQRNEVVATGEAMVELPAARC